MVCWNDPFVHTTRPFNPIYFTMETIATDTDHEKADHSGAELPASPTAAAPDADESSRRKRMLAAKERFYAELKTKNTLKKIKKTETLTEHQYDDICNVLRGWKVGVKHSSEQIKWHTNYVLVENTSREAALRWNKNGECLKVATKERMFEIIMEEHVALGHAKDARNTYKRIKETWYGITREDIQLAVNLCPICFGTQAKINAKQMPLKMILSLTIGSRAQMDLIDMTSQQDPDGYCWILRLVDHLSGFGAVRALKSKTSEEYAIAIIQILCSFPDFDILQSDNGGEFLGETVKILNE